MGHWRKSEAGFTPLGTSLEAPFERLTGETVPEERFFVCNSGDSVAVDPEIYRLKIKGDAVERVVTLRLSDLEALPQHEVLAYVECAGNQRTLFSKIDGHVIDRESDGDDVAWTLGGIGQALWSGPRLADVLALAGVSPQAAWVAPMGLDVLNPECDIEIPMPIEKALDPDTLVGLRMNGAALPVDHGAPARMVVPGWVGTYWVKWVGWLTVSAREIRNYRTDEYYVIDGVTVTEQNIKASLCLPFPAELAPGRQRIEGLARSPGQEIARVEWSADGGDWTGAEIVQRSGKWGWTRFAFDWDAAPGSHVLRCRAVDAAGRSQPEVALMNEGTLLYNAVIPHPVTVTVT
ncbi:molybdopterin-dependent oxidoreductase [Marinibacterium profundimaris]|uniref:molybdopterin-dependent oxidoreductase n=1 Tax=Marinibacterium profundimaris TaxID=1679460 RepID=UPI000B51F586|nr:molybdopterin-dependent oxidoreductase [Marinibacterium profundimaris]